MQGRRIEIRGAVQGVGFRPFVWRTAREWNVRGRVRNDAAGVTIDAFASAQALEGFTAALERTAPAAARVRALKWKEIPVEEADGFDIVQSEGAPERRVSIPPDLGLCADCEKEILDPANRRFRYPFTNCTNCGPRFTIALDVPYDRAVTSMAPFAMCEPCAREYRDPADRRFHAQPNACPTCGPRLWAVDGSGAALGWSDPVARAAQELSAGWIVAVKGLGGFHLACDATSSFAVRLLRERKRRDEKPFAVMVRDLAEAERLGRLGDEERALLTSVERPIVLVERGGDDLLAAEVAPGIPLVGLMLPYTPLHVLLLEAAKRPLVMTSANLSDEPIVYRNDEAVARLGRIADVILLHDREIVTRADDPVTRVVSGQPLVLRRSRGYVPRPIRAPRPFTRPVLACGAQLKNAFCFGIGDEAHLGPHVGDLENLETLYAFEDAVERMERFLRVKPEVLAHDLHPAYLSTQYALSRARNACVGVQHHHAHVASAMGENGLDGPVFGLAWDGTGYGDDGTAWGGELLLADFARFERLGTFRPIPLAGGDKAIREVWRIALAVLDDAFDGAPPLEALPLFSRLGAEEVRIVRRMIASGLNSPLAHGVGRYFDAFGAIGLSRPRSAFEGQTALLWNCAATGGGGERLPYELDLSTSPWTIDLRPAVRAFVEGLARGATSAMLSNRFHETLARAGEALVREAASRHGRRPVVLTGGCFQNALLAERTRARLAPDFDVYTHREVPPGDGGIALGQALVANARLSRN